jgi:NADH:ubiquinone oxidoreductase subunit C
MITIESLSKIKDKKILFIEGSETDKEYEKTIKNSVDIYINIKNDHQLKKIIDGLSKGRAEATLTIEALKYLNREEFDNIFKISGRYYLNNSYEDSVFDENVSIFKLSSGSFVTIFYKINKKDFKLYLKTLDHVFSSGKMYEVVFFNAFKNIAKEINNIGVAGEVSVDGNFIIQ